MERRVRVRLDELRNDAGLAPSALRGVMPRLESFRLSFVASLGSAERQTNAKQSVAGLLSDLGSKDAESIASRHDRERQGLQKFLGQSEWDHGPLRRELVRQGGQELGEADAVLVFDPSAFPEKGTASVGVQRQGCGRLGQLDNGQVGIDRGYFARREPALVDFRLSLPKEWAGDRKRRKKAGVPTTVRFPTRHELILPMLDERGASLPHAWTSGDDELGRSSWFREPLRFRGESYLLAVPSNTSVRDRQEPDPPREGRGRWPRVPFRRVDRWQAALPEEAWQTTFGPRRGERALGGASGPDPGAGADRRSALGRGGVPGGLPRASIGRLLEARLPALKRPVDHRLGGVRSGVQGPAPDRGVPETGQGRSGLGGLSSADVGGLASPPNAVADRQLVSHAGDPAGKKSGPPR